MTFLKNVPHIEVALASADGAHFIQMHNVTLSGQLSKNRRNKENMLVKILNLCK